MKITERAVLTLRARIKDFDFSDYEKLKKKIDEESPAMGEFIDSLPMPEPNSLGEAVSAFQIHTSAIQVYELLKIQIELDRLDKL